MSREYHVTSGIIIIFFNYMSWRAITVQVAYLSSSYSGGVISTNIYKDLLLKDLSFLGLHIYSIIWK